MTQNCSNLSGVCSGLRWEQGRTGPVAWTIADANHRRTGEGAGEEQQMSSCIAFFVTCYTFETLTLSIQAMGIGSDSVISVSVPLAPKMG